MPEVGFEPTFPDLRMAQQQIPEVNPYSANLENVVSSNNAGRWQMGFNSVFKGLDKYVLN